MPILTRITAPLSASSNWPKGKRTTPGCRARDASLAFGVGGHATDLGALGLKEAEDCAYSALTAALKITQMKKTKKHLQVSASRSKRRLFRA
jgi:hypothetical protein